MQTCLPQDEQNPTARQAALDAARAKYTFCYTRFNGVAMVPVLPDGESAGSEWLKLVAEKSFHVLYNAARVGMTFKPAHEKESFGKKMWHFLNTNVADVPAVLAKDATAVVEELDEQTKSLMATARQLTEGGLHAFIDQMTDRMLHGQVGGRATALSDFDQLFVDIQKPEGLEDWRSDASFARLRLSGANPVMLQRMDRLDPRFTLDGAQSQALLGSGDSLEGAQKEGRLFVVDLTGLDGVVGGTFPDGLQKVLPAPLAVFAVRRDTRQFVPLGVRCRPEQRLWTPLDGKMWGLAKSNYNTADGNVHQAVSHLATTHLVMEAVILCMRRQVAPWHPVRVLLEPHFLGTLNINDAADTSLCRPQGGVDAVLSGPIAVSRATAESGVKTWKFNGSMLPTWLKSRGLDGVEIADYPYRDDALLLWPAIRGWVGHYLRLYYRGDAEVASDIELQAFARELVSQDGGRISDFGEAGGGVQTLDYLTSAVAHVIFTAAVQHSAVNFPQYNVMAFTPNYPLASYAEVADEPVRDPDAALLAQLPPLDMALFQLELGYLLGTTRFGTLGDYAAFDDQRVAPLLADFRHVLSGIETQIADRNAVRTPYTTLTPGLVTQSINI